MLGMVVRGHEARRGGSPGCHSDAYADGVHVSYPGAGAGDGGRGCSSQPGPGGAAIEPRRPRGCGGASSMSAGPRGAMTGAGAAGGASLTRTRPMSCARFAWMLLR